MRELSLEDLSREHARFDQAALATPEIDAFCSSTAWILPADRAFSPGRDPFLFETDAGYIAFMRSRDPRGWDVLNPLESSWLLATPLVGGDPQALFARFARIVPQAVTMVCLSGVAPDGILAKALQEQNRFSIHPGPPTVRHLFSLEDGLEGFLARRSAQFRSRLRRARKRFAREGFDWESFDPSLTPAALYERIIAIERTSWKGLRRVGIDSGDMNRFYRLMVARLMADNHLRLLFLTREGEDVAYILGGVLGATFRGLQFSFRHDLEDYSLGNVSQSLMVEQLCQEGLRYYDLGTDIAYKRRWADYQQVTLTYLLVTNR
ncbi:MAG: GNAT family N-acetyltransferase [Vulcanimicrobiota bacterium]